MNIGHRYLGSGKCEFTVWSPLLEKVELSIVSPRARTVALHKDEGRYWRAVVEGVPPGSLYFYRLNGAAERPDPAANFQPQGVHGPSQVVDHGAFEWSDAGWEAPPLEQMIIYELHTGTFTPEGTFEAIIPRLGDLTRMGVNAIEVMPVAQFPGGRNWGYDGVHPFAAQNSYGGPEGLKRLVDACHGRGVSVILDVVYNHLGPEGNYFGEFGPYFTEKYKSPWGNAINFDDAYSDGVRNFFIENALYWLSDFHVDGLRLDAVHGIFDMSAKHFLEELAERVAELSERRGRKFFLIAESNLNDTRLILPKEERGYGLDAQWNDDFHHSLRTLLTGERLFYYEDFGSVEDMAKAIEEGFVYSGQYSAFRRKSYGSSSKEIPGRQLVVFSQNHDQVGNQMLGERLGRLVSFEALKLAAGAVLVSPYVPLLFMGEEYDDSSPFLYFISHQDPDLVAAVREGRKQEFKGFNWRAEPPDPQSVETFSASKLRWEQRREGRHKTLLEFYTRLIRLRRKTPALAHLDKRALEVRAHGRRALTLRRWHGESHVLAIMNFDKRELAVTIDVAGRWAKVLDSADEASGGAGSLLPAEAAAGRELVVSPLGFALYERKR
jgi:maltooligosyltrehalose trehalohydrolase